MLTFTKTPPDPAPLGQKAEYAVACDRPSTIGIRITDAQTGALLGTKRFAAVTQATCDIAPCLRRAVRFQPRNERTGFTDSAGRVLRVRVSAASADSPETVTLAPDRLFYPGEDPYSEPVLLGSMPRKRLIAPGEQDELTLLTDSDLMVRVTAQGAGMQSGRSFSPEGTGLLVFRLDTRDFPDAETIRVDAASCGTVDYTVVPAVPDSHRIAWRSRTGSIEHYTFPVERSKKITVKKNRIYGPEGYRVTAAEAEARIVLSSAYETREMLEPLSELLTAPEVWLVAGGVYTPLDVLSEEAVIHRYGVMSSLEIEFRPASENSVSWN